MQKVERGVRMINRMVVKVMEVRVMAVKAMEVRVMVAKAMVAKVEARPTKMKTLDHSNAKYKSVGMQGRYSSNYRYLTLNATIETKLITCSFFRPGNCNVSKYNSFKTPMLMDESPCGPWCPPGG